MHQQCSVFSSVQHQYSLLSSIPPPMQRISCLVRNLNQYLKVICSQHSVLKSAQMSNIEQHWAALTSWPAEQLWATLIGIEQQWAACQINIRQTMVPPTYISAIISTLSWVFTLIRLYSIKPVRCIKLFGMTGDLKPTAGRAFEAEPSEPSDNLLTRPFFTPGIYFYKFFTPGIYFY